MTKISLEVIHEVLTRVEKKVDRTNGRVSKLEAWKNRLAGAIVIMNIIILPIIYFFIKNYLTT